MSANEEEEEKEDEPLCTICLDVLGDTPHRLSCSHEFHATCIGEWLRTSSTCPVCRTYPFGDLFRMGTDILNYHLPQRSSAVVDPRQDGRTPLPRESVERSAQDLIVQQYVRGILEQIQRLQQQQPAVEIDEQDESVLQMLADRSRSAMSSRARQLVEVLNGEEWIHDNPDVEPDGPLRTMEQTLPPSGLDDY